MREGDGRRGRARSGVARRRRGRRALLLHRRRALLLLLLLPGALASICWLQARGKCGGGAKQRGVSGGADAAGPHAASCSL